MALFQYRALKMDGLVAEGQIEAGGRQEAFRQLEGRGLKPLGLAEKASPGAAHKTTGHVTWHRKRVPHSAVENFTRQLSSLLAAGVPLSRALHIVSKEASTPVAKEQWQSIHDLVIDGSSLAAAMGQWPDTFPRVYVAMVHSGETGGFLDVVLGQIADFQLREKELKGKVVSALIYPLVLICLSAAVLTFLLVFFIPRFEGIFAGFGAVLPMLTQIVVALSKAVTKYGPFVAIAVVVAVIATRRWLKTDQGRRTGERLILRLPIFGNLTARFAMARFCRMLGTLIKAGVPLINALRVARESIANQTLTDAVTASIDRVKQGGRLATSLADCSRLFPSSVLEMISVAEETGRMDQELMRLATVTESDLDRELKTAVALAEPAFLIVMAGFIGTIIVSMLLPIFSLQDYIK